MSLEVERIRKFVSYAHLLKGDEKGEAQVYCDRLFQAFGHQGYKEAGATLEERIRKASGKGVNFADLVWRPRLIMEMKKKRERLHLHYRQAFDYWINCVPSRPRYVVLCNFDEFHIYDFDKQIDDPVDYVELDQLPLRYPAFNFLLPNEKPPLFDNDRQDVSRKAADKMAELYKRLTGRKRRAVPKDQAQRFILQTVVAMFAEDIDLLPAGIVQSLVGDCLERGQNSYDLFNGLFSQMDSKRAAKGGRFAGVPYFNGGLFAEIVPIELEEAELKLIGGEEGAASENWSKVNPSIFGTLFQDSMEKEQRHAYGAHFTSEFEIQRIVVPTIVRPWQERIEEAKKFSELIALRRELMEFKVLDPACGSGNFLYVSFREMARLDIMIINRMREMLSDRQFKDQFRLLNAISPKQFFGIELDRFGVELTKVTLMLAKKLAMDEVARAFETGGQRELSLEGDSALPLDNLDNNIVCGDALFAEWPNTNAIIGNPPYQSKNKLSTELGSPYRNRLRAAYPSIPGRADYCTYWFRLAHDRLAKGCRAGLVGTNTIRQNYSREASLDHIVSSGGEITEAVSSMIWPGEAIVHVSVVNWIKGCSKGDKRLYIQEGNNQNEGWRHVDLDIIGPALSFDIDVTKAIVIRANKRRGTLQGQTHGNEGFLLSPGEASILIRKNRDFDKILFPFLIADDMLGHIEAKPSRFVIDFGQMDAVEAQSSFKRLFDVVKEKVLPDRQKAALKESKANSDALAANQNAKLAKDHSAALKIWWQLFRPRMGMLQAIGSMSRYIACSRVTKRPIFEFVDPAIHPNDALQVFPFEDDYTFGILQSSLHWKWFINRCSTLKSDYRYTSNTVFDTFPWPQAPSLASIRAVADASSALRNGRNKLKARYSLCLRDLYRQLDLPGDHPLKTLHSKLDAAVSTAYGFGEGNQLSLLLALNREVAELEAGGIMVQGPGLPSIAENPAAYITNDRITL